MLEMSELSHDEELALIGLLKAVIQVDKQLGFEESEELKRVAAMMGAERFHERVEEARGLFQSLESIKEHAQNVTRQPARQLIFNLLLEMAKRDELLTGEEDLLEQIAGLWEVEYFRK